MTGSLRRVRPQWARDEQEGWEVYSVDRWHVRYAEQGRSVDVRVEDGWAADGRPTISLWVDNLAWRAGDDAAEVPLSAGEHAVVVARLQAALELLGQQPIVERG